MDPTGWVAEWLEWNVSSPGCQPALHPAPAHAPLRRCHHLEATWCHGATRSLCYHIPSARLLGRALLPRDSVPPRTKSNQIKSNQIKSNQIKSNQINPYTRPRGVLLPQVSYYLCAKETPRGKLLLKDDARHIIDGTIFEKLAREIREGRLKRASMFTAGLKEVKPQKAAAGMGQPRLRKED